MHWTNARIAFIAFVCITQIAGDNNGTLIEHLNPSISTSYDEILAIRNSLPRNQSKTAVPLKNAQPNRLHDTVISTNPSSPDNFTDLLRLSDVLMVFDLKQLANKWSHVKDALQPNCAAHMTNYFRGLQQRKLWAIKMDDASGHYTTALFYGNNYWIGSLSLCKAIYKTTLSNVPVRTQNEQDHTALTFNDAYSPSATLEHENPPFIPGFYVLKVRINESEIVKYPRTIRLGMCLPNACSYDDIERMALLAENPVAQHQLEIIGVRSPTENVYEYWNDRTYIILISSTVIVFILMVAATGYDLYLDARAKRALRNKGSSKDDMATDSSSGIGCTTYDLTGAVPNKNDLAIGIGIPRGMNNNNSDENLADGSINVQEIKLSLWSELLLSFSVISNFKAICDRSVGNDTIPSIHGLRAFSMAWVILGHTCIIVFKYADNMELRKDVEKEFWFQIISNAAFSVDTFFFISGFLVSYIYFRTNAKGKLKKLSQDMNEITSGGIHFIGLIGYRFIRLTAPYMYVLLLVEIVMKYFHHHSVFEPPTLDHDNCPNYWWRNILYINTLFPVEQMCMLWSWYLADDTQFFIVGAFCLIIAVRHFKFATSMLFTFLVSSWMTTGFIAYQNNHIPNSDDPLALFDKIYDKPWTRFGPYMVGMCVGWFLFRTNCKIRMSRSTVIVGWVSAGFCLFWLVFGLYKVQLSPILAATYSSLSHTAWAMALAWIVVACSSGNGGYVNKILSAPVIYPFSRVTYCAYLVHPVAIRFVSLSSDATLHLGSDSMMVLFFGHVVLSYILAFIISVAFEAPVVTMLRILTPNRKKILVENRE